ncbi:YpsA SLOG family protein [Mariprofundus ferrinatatus]
MIKIISGGQTGVDRAALDAAMDANSSAGSSSRRQNW